MKLPSAETVRGVVQDGLFLGGAGLISYSVWLHDEKIGIGVAGAFVLLQALILAIGGHAPKTTKPPAGE